MPANILIVDDNSLTLRLCSDLLQAHGFGTASVADGSAALDSISRESPDLVLLDIQLDGESGLEVLRRLKDADATRSVPVVAMTAFAMKGDKEKFMAAGFDAYLAKPFFLDELLATIAPFVGMADARRRLTSGRNREAASGR